MWYVKHNNKTEENNWHIWFAWFPVKVHTYKNDSVKKVWLENVLRCRTGEECFTPYGTFICEKYIYKERNSI